MTTDNAPIPAPASPAHPRAPVSEARKAEILSLAESTPHRTLIPVGEAAALVRELEEARAELEADKAERHRIAFELAGLRGRLPLTADGVSVVPGDAVFRIRDDGNIQQSSYWNDARPAFRGPVHFEVLVSEPFYSTRAAAESALAARGREAGEGTK